MISLSISVPRLHRFAGLVGQHLHVMLGEIDDIGVDQRLAAQFVELHREAVLLAVRLLAHEAQRLHGLQEAVDRRLGHGELDGEVGNAGLAALRQRLQDRKYLQHRRDGLGLLAIDKFVIHAF